MCRGLGNSSSFQVDFAPFAKKKKKANATADVDTANVADWKWFYSLADIVDKLGHRGRSLQVLKVDVEGAEVGGRQLSGTHVSVVFPVSDKVSFAR